MCTTKSPGWLCTRWVFCVFWIVFLPCCGEEKRVPGAGNRDSCSDYQSTTGCDLRPKVKRSLFLWSWPLFESVVPVARFAKWDIPSIREVAMPYPGITGIIALVLLLHGIGHVLGLFPTLGWARRPNWTDRSWLLTGLLGETATRRLNALIWLAATLGFVVAGMGLLGQFISAGAWQTLAVLAAFVSLLGIIFYWQAFPDKVNKVGAILIDIVLLVALLWERWSPVISSVSR
jgi:hypothetical protein